MHHRKVLAMIYKLHEPKDLKSFFTDLFQQKNQIKKAKAVRKKKWPQADEMSKMITIIIT